MVLKHAIFLAMMMLVMSLLKLLYFKYCTITIFNVRINILLHNIYIYIYNFFFLREKLLCILVC